MKYAYFVFLLFSVAHARILDVGPGRQYASVQLAAAVAQAGDTIRVAAGTYGGGQYIENLQGRDDAWITIRAETEGQVLFRGGSEALHLTDAAFLRIEGLMFEEQTGNGVNIDDGGSYDTPSHHIIFERCRWRRMQASGNNDQLKMSGVDYFVLRSCEFEEGAAGGSMIDMVGCHSGLIIGCKFSSGGSNSIQAKGGSSQLRIERNTFIDGGERAINIGGSTGDAYFRPLDADYEAMEVAVFSNWFSGSTAPIAFVGAVRCAVINNTIITPKKWVMRILQESTAPRFLPCGQNIFWNNLIYIGNAAAAVAINVGPNTAPATFDFSHNLWFNRETPSWATPNLPVPEESGIYAQDPLILDASTPGSPLGANSPALHAGNETTEPALDYHGRGFSNPRAIGAVEGAIPNGIAQTEVTRSFEIQAFPNPSRGSVYLRFTKEIPRNKELRLLDLTGREVMKFAAAMNVDEGELFRIDIPPAIRRGFLLLEVRAGNLTRLVPLVLR